MNSYDRARELRKEYKVAGHPEIYDELCTCGCYRSQHTDTVELGHGQCQRSMSIGIAYCSCMQFTWNGFLVKQGPALGELPKAEDIILPQEKAVPMPERVR